MIKYLVINYILIKPRKDKNFFIEYFFIDVICYIYNVKK